MNQEWVTVTQIEPQGIWVESLQRSACDSCNARSGCGQRTLSQLGRTVRLWVPSTAKHHVGQQVLLQLPGGGLAFSALLLYGLPLLCLMLAAGIGQTYSELSAVIMAVLGLLLGLLLSRQCIQKYQHLWQPSISNACIETKIID